MQETEKNQNVGYSSNITEEVFDKTRDNRKSRDEITYIITVVAAVTVTLLVGIFRYQDLKGTLFFIGIIAVVGVIFFFILKQKKQPDITYDGVVKFIEKSVETYRNKGKYLVTYIAITREDGKIFVYNNIISSVHNDYTTYYQIGDKVRHHKGYFLPEKYDKTQDDKVVCILCGHLIDKEKDYCSNCQKVLLK